MARKQKRWMKSVIETSKTDLPALPWTRQMRALKRAGAASSPAPVQTPAKQRAG